MNSDTLAIAETLCQKCVGMGFTGFILNKLRLEYLEEKKIDSHDFFSFSYLILIYFLIMKPLRAMPVHFRCIGKS
jgi:hypothetical protein